MRLLRDGLVKTKIVATIGPIGPGISDPAGNPMKGYDDLLPWLVREGVDVIRINMAFYTLAEEGSGGQNEREILSWLKKNKDKLAKNVAVLGDLPGPKIRLRDVRGADNPLEQGDMFCLDFGYEGSSGIPEGERGASVAAYKRSFGQLNPTINGYLHIDEYVNQPARDVIISIADGKVLLRAVKSTGGVVECRVIKGGAVGEGKGLTIKGAAVDIPSFQDEDKQALRFLLENAGDLLAFVGVSFVKHDKDILKVQEYLEDYFVREQSLTPEQARLRAPSLIAKIETQQAVEIENVDDVLDAADGAMVARGDLALQLDPERVPAIQKDIIRRCNLRGKPVITATEMLDSMERNMEPTRAEVTDVFNAILDGTDAVMLSGETAEGKYPVHAVRMMVKIASEAERYYFDKVRAGEGLAGRFQSQELKSLVEATNERLHEKMDKAMEESNDWLRALYQEKLQRSVRQTNTDRISQSACVLSEGEDCKAIVAPTQSGRTARMMSRFRPKVKIVGAAHDVANMRKLILSFGVYPVDIGYPDHPEKGTIDEVFESADAKVVQPGYIPWQPSFRLLQPRDRVIATGGIPLFTPGTTNLIQIRTIGKEERP